MNHTKQIAEAFARLEKELRRQPQPAAVKAAIFVVNDRLQKAEAWSEAGAPVQRDMFPTPTDPIKVAYSDTNHSLKSAKGVIESGSAVKWRRWVLFRIKEALDGRTCDGLVSVAERHMPNRSMHSTISARLNELEGEGLLKRAGERPTRSGRNAGVYHITTKGLEALSNGASNGK